MEKRCSKSREQNMQRLRGKNEHGKFRESPAVGLQFRIQMEK